MKIQRALISVSDKSGIVEFARELHQQGIEILSTGGTAKTLQAEGIPTVEVSQFTGFPEIMDGRVKTLHPKIHGGLLFLRGNEEHEKQAKANGIRPIDLVVVNLYPFEATIAREDVTLPEAIEQIDIGGPSMIRSAAKNYQSVTVVTDPADYPAVLEDMKEENGGTGLALRERLAIKAFTSTSSYDRAIAGFLNREQETSAAFRLELPLEIRLRYGENPHQHAELYGDFGSYFEKLQGKELSYNNILDISAAAGLIAEFPKPTVAILKHTNPCGIGTDPDLRKAWDKAFSTDKQAPFGGIIICNRPLTLALAKAISEIFSEVIIAPDFAADARSLLSKKKNLRLMKMLKALPESGRDMRSVVGGLLVQDTDSSDIPELEHKVVTERPPSRDEIEAMEFGWKVVKHVKSNAIVYAGKDRTLGIGAGQMSRVDSSRIAVWKAQEAGLSLKGSAVCSDAFFPFPMACSPPPMPVRPAPSSRADPCGTRKSLPLPTSGAWPWCLRDSAISAISADEDPVKPAEIGAIRGKFHSELQKSETFAAGSGSISRMDEQNENDALWNLLGKARKIEASPYFTRQVLREVRQQAARPAVSLAGILRWLVPASAAAALVVGWSALQWQHHQAEEEFNAYFDSAADLQSLVAQEDAAIWITEPGS